MAAEKGVGAQELAKLLEKQFNMGQGILKQQPVQRETCERWTAETRELLAAHYGAASQRLREFKAANRKIFTSFETDPSYYLTQVVANLHRELRVLERCAKEKRDEAEAEEALLALKGVKRARPKIPACLWAQGGASAEVSSFLEAQDVDITAGSGGKNGGELLWNLASRRDLRYGVVLLGAPKDGAVSSEGLLVAGYLTGRLGRGRVLVLLESAGGLPSAAGFLRTLSAKEKDKWKQEIESDLKKLRSGSHK